MISPIANKDVKSIQEVFEHRITSYDNLPNYQLLTQICIEAFEHFRQLKLKELDGLVGENGCQIRAWKNAHLASEMQADPSRVKSIEDTIATLKAIDVVIKDCKQSNEKVTQLALQWKKLLGMQDRISLPKKDILFSAYECFLEAFEEYKTSLVKRIEHAFSLASFDRDAQFIIYAYLLNMTDDREAQGRDAYGFPVRHQANPKLLNTKYKVSKVVSRHLVQVSQRNLGYLSRQYVQEVAKKYDNATLNDRLSNRFIAFNAHEVPCGPLYYDFYALLLEAKDKKLNMIVDIRFENSPNSLFLLYKGRGLNKSIEQIKLTDVNTNSPAIILEGICASKGNIHEVQEKILDAFKEHGLEKIVLGICAQHGQYPPTIPTPKELQAENDLGLKEHAVFAEEKGFSMKNPSIFLIRHVFTDMIKNHICGLASNL